MWLHDHDIVGALHFIDDFLILVSGLKVVAFASDTYFELLIFIVCYSLRVLLVNLIQKKV